MSRQLLSPCWVVCGLALIALLVVGGLAWVSVTALDLEDAQRKSAADADLLVRERFALWRLDGHLLPPLGLENNRPYSHFFSLYAAAPVALDASGTPTADPGRIPSPLLTADLPPWMTLHFRLDPERGWESPQVIPPVLEERLSAEPFGLSLTNCTLERGRQLADLRERFPAAEAVRVLSEQERSEPVEEPFLIPVPSGDDSTPERPAPTLPPAVPPGWGKPGSHNTVAGGRGGLWCDEPMRNASRFVEGLRAELGKIGPKPIPLDNTEDGRKLVPTQTDPRLPMPLELQPQSRAALPRGNQAAPESEAAREALARKSSTDNALLNRAGYEPGGKLQGNPSSENSGSGRGIRSTPNPRTVGPGGGGLIPGGPIGPVASSDQDKSPAKQVGEWNDYFRNEAQKLKEMQGQRKKEDNRPVAQKEDTTAAKKPLDTSKRLTDELLEQRGRRRANDYIALAKEGGGIVPLAEAKAEPIVAPVAVHIGPVRPRWLTAADGSRLLLLVRVAKSNEKVAFQGVVLDWFALKSELIARITELLPHAELTPQDVIQDTLPERSMTALPVRLDANETAIAAAATWTPLRYGLVIAWAAAVLAIFAVAFGARAIVATSERRVRFASAVTHELRTPLTAMQLHLDLLNSGLIADETKKAEYLATISTEADRLNRLVENVLDFAKLEKKSAQATARHILVADVLDSIHQTWKDRLTLEGFELVIERETPANCVVRIDPRVVAQVLGNLLDNARKYANTADDRRIWVRATGTGSWVAIAVEDRGPGVKPSERKTIFRPFRRGTDTADSGGAGLGLSLARQWAELYGGTLSYQPHAEAPGARFLLELPMG